MSAHKRQCLCGAVTFTAESVEHHHHACHCGMCRRWAGGPLLAASAEGVIFAGEENITVFGSSEWAERGFCKVCGSNLFYRLRDGGGYHMPVGVFDDQSAFKVVGEIFIDRKPGGYAFAGDHPRLTEEETMAMFAEAGAT